MSDGGQFPGRSNTIPARGSNQARTLDRSGGIDRSGGTADPRSGEISDDVPSIMEVERTIKKLEREIDDLTDDFANLARFESDADCDWEGHRDRVFVALNDGGDWKNEKLSLAQAKRETCILTGQSGEDLYRTWRDLKAALDSVRRSISTLETRLSVQQSLLKHLRQISGLEAR